jgi:hypothetical protein
VVIGNSQIAPNVESNPEGEAFFIRFRGPQALGDRFREQNQKLWSSFWRARAMEEGSGSQEPEREQKNRIGEFGSIHES